MNGITDKSEITSNVIERTSQKTLARPYYQSSIYKNFPLNDAFYGVRKSVEEPVQQPKKKKKKIGKIPLITAGVIALTAAFVNRAGFRRVYRKSSELYSDLSNRIQASELSGQTKSIFESVQTLFSRGLKKVSDIFKFSANAVAVRDSGADILLNKTKPTAKFANWTRRVFGNIATNELDRRYDTVERTMRHFTADIADKTATALSEGGEELKKVISIKGRKQTLAQWLQELGGEVQELRSVYESGFSKDARIVRDKVRDSAFSDLPERQWKRITQEGGIFDLKKYKNYITEDLTAQTRVELSNDIAQARKLFTNNVRHEYRSIRVALRDISDTLRMDDREGKSCIEALKKAAEEFRSCHGSTEAYDRQQVIQKIHTLTRKLNAAVTGNDKYTPERLRLIQEQIEGLEDLAGISGMGSQGTLQRISTILKGLSSSDNGIISANDFKKYKKTIHTMTQKLNHATTLETDDYFIKKAEIKIGSAPTDLFGLFGPLGLGAYAVARGKTKDEKVEAALTAAVPLVGGIGTYIIGTVKMFSAGKNCAFSFLTGIGLNIIGRGAVKLYRAYQEKQSLVKIALDSYNSIIGKTPIKEESPNIQ